MKLHITTFFCVFKGTKQLNSQMRAMYTIPIFFDELASIMRAVALHKIKLFLFRNLYLQKQNVVLDMLEKKQKFRIGCFPVLFLIVVCCILAYSLYSKHNEVSEEDPIIEEQSIKYFPPKLTENNDIIFEKSIRWKDFFNREQKIQFSTSQSEYFKTVAFHRNVVRNINIHQLYIELLEFDNHKLNSVLDKLCNRANN